jgi:hypothetical protein
MKKKKLKIALGFPLCPSALTIPTTNPSFKLSSTSRQKVASNQPNPGNFERLSSVRDCLLGFNPPGFSLHTNTWLQFEWHNLLVQELTRKTKMEIKAINSRNVVYPTLLFVHLYNSICSLLFSFFQG